MPTLPNTTRTIIAAVLLVSLVLFLANPVQGALNTELIINGDFETGNLSGWTVDDPNPAADPGTIYTQPQWTGWGVSWFGNHFYFSGTDGDSQSSQVIDVSADAAQIDAGNIWANLSAAMSSWANSDIATISAYFLDAGDVDLGGTISITAMGNPVKDMTDPDCHEVIDGPVPVGTRKIKVVIFTDYSAGGDVDGYVDNVSLKLSWGIMGLVGQWDFDDPCDLTKATIGTDLILTGSQESVAGIEGGDGAARIGVGSYYDCNHGVVPNGGGSKVNEWTVVMDVNYPASNWKTFFQTDANNLSDGECFVHSNGTLGEAATGYSTNSTQANTWYRVVISVDNGNFYKIYVNTELWLEGTVQTVDGDYSLDTLLLLFADENGEDNPIDISTIMVFDHPLSQEIITALKGPGGQDLPADVLTEPYLQNVKQNGITIMWELSGIESSQVEYGTDVNYGDVVSGVYTASGANTYIYKVVLTGLDAGSTYHYRVVKGAEPQADQTFTTSPVGNASFTFGVWADSQGTNHGEYPADPYEPTKKMMEHMADNVDFGVTAGDLCEDGHSYSSVKEFYIDRVLNYLGQTKPWFNAWGNHDMQPNSIIRKFADMPSKDRGTPYHAGYGNFSFDYGGCHFICIDDDYPNNTDPERWDWTWIENDLIQANANNARFIFLFTHRAPYYERWYDGEKPVRDNLVPLMEQYGVDICFSGHMHAYERGYLNGVYYCVTGGGSWLDLGENLVYDWPHMTVGGYHDLAPGIDGGLVNEYVKVEVDEYGFTATMIAFNPDGTVMDGVEDTFSVVDALADVNNDDVIDFHDFALVAKHWPGTCGDPECNASDITGDGVVDMSDIEMIARGWLWPSN